MVENERDDEKVQDLEEQVEELAKISQENNKMLRGMQRHMRMGTVMRILYWIVIIGSMLGVYYYLQPFIEPLLETYDTLIGLPDAVKNIDIPGSLGF